MTERDYAIRACSTVETVLNTSDLEARDALLAQVCADLVAARQMNSACMVSDVKTSRAYVWMLAVLRGRLLAFYNVENTQVTC